MRLILTADDFGRSAAVNEAVEKAYVDGALTSASLMVGGEAFDEAVRIARRRPGLAVGLHITVVHGRPVLAPSQVRHLVKRSGQFGANPVLSGMRGFFHPAARRELAMEVTAQFERFAATGLTMSHVDGHLHMHLHPVVLPHVMRLAVQNRAAGIRLPRETLRRVGVRDTIDLGWASLLNTGASLARPGARTRGLAIADHTAGTLDSGAMSLAAVRRALRHVAHDESAELCFHPCVGEAVEPKGPCPGDLATLTDPRLRRLLLKHDAVRCTYRDLLPNEALACC